VTAILVLLARLALPQDAVHLECRSPGGPVETARAAGPDGTGAALVISSDDDHSKESHACMATYELVVTDATGQRRSDVLEMSDAEYGRGLIARISGFSADGQRVFGLLVESGRYANAALMVYDVKRRTSQLLDLDNQFKGTEAAHCGSATEVVGTTGDGAIVLQVTPAGTCRARSRWIVDESHGSARPLPRGAPVSRLFNR
jgi:hypothetical protein